MKKIIFLDIDGVFNCEEWYIKRQHIVPELPHPLDEFDPTRVELFNKIVEATGADIVVSSTWRADGMDAMTNLFSQLGIKGNIIGLTPHMRSDHSLRGNEIYAWLNDHVVYPWTADPTVHKEYELLNEDGTFKMMRSNKLNVDYTYCIIDDDSDMLFWQRNNFVNTSWMDGLTQQHVDLAINILNNKPIQNPDVLKERILCAALHVKDGEKHVHTVTNIDSGFVLCGRRHHDCYYMLSMMDGRDKFMVGREGQGFITNFNRFVDRREGFLIAQAAGQLLNPSLYDKDNPDDILISEGLY